MVTNRKAGAFVHRDNSGLYPGVWLVVAEREGETAQIELTEQDARKLAAALNDTPQPAPDNKLDPADATFIVHNFYAGVDLVRWGRREGVYVLDILDETAGQRSTVQLSPSQAREFARKLTVLTDLRPGDQEGAA